MSRRVCLELLTTPQEAVTKHAQAHMVWVCDQILHSPPRTWLCIFQSSIYQWNIWPA